MNWIKIQKNDKNKSRKGTYSDWKPELAEEGSHQCVYCAISESRFGGIRNFHVEHFKPKSLKRFKKLENKWSNLFFACAICNTFKGSDWKPNPDNKGLRICYIDPSKTDYSEMIEIDWNSGKIEGKNMAMRYMIEKIFLNRPQLQFERRRFFLSLLLEELNCFYESVQNQIQKKNDKELVSLYLDFVNTLLDSRKIEKKIYEAIPYEDKDVRRN